MQRLQYRNSARRAATSGFSMAELMAAVAMIGILAAIATVSVRKYVATSKTSEALTNFASIKLAQETYKDETLAYLDVSTDLTSAGSFYPANPTPGQKKMNFAGPGDGAANWAMLNVKFDAPVLFVYACKAGAAGTAPAALGTDITVGNWPAAASGKPWYVVKARADLDGDGINTVYVSASFRDELFSQND